MHMSNECARWIHLIEKKGHIADACIYCKCYVYHALDAIYSVPERSSNTAVSSGGFNALSVASAQLQRISD